MGSLRFTILAWLFAIAGCATSYQPFDGKTGVSELRVGDERYRVEYHGDPNSGFEQARDFVLLRGAEVMSELGCRHFSVTSRREETRARVASASKSTRVTITAPTGDPSIVADYSTITPRRRFRCGPRGNPGPRLSSNARTPMPPVRMSFSLPSTCSARCAANTHCRRSNCSNP